MYNLALLLLELILFQKLPNVSKSWSRTLLKLDTGGLISTFIIINDGL